MFRPRCRRDRIETEIMLANGIAQRQIALRSDAEFDPGMFVERHALRGELPAQPVQLLHQHDARAKPRRGQRGGNAAEAAADDQHIGLPPSRHTLNLWPFTGCACLPCARR